MLLDQSQELERASHAPADENVHAPADENVHAPADENVRAPSFDAFPDIKSMVI